MGRESEYARLYSLFANVPSTELVKELSMRGPHKLQLGVDECLLEEYLGGIILNGALKSICT